MKNGPQLKSRRASLAVDDKLARLEAVNEWTEEPAQAQAEAVAQSPHQEAQKPPEAPTSLPAKPVEEDDPWAAVRALVGPEVQASFRLPAEVHSQLKIAVAMLNDKKVTMTQVIVKGILDQTAFIHARLEAKKKQ